MRPPPSRSACLIQPWIVAAHGSNSLAIFHATSGPGQRYDLIPEFRGVPVPRSRHRDTLLSQSKSVHQTGGTPTFNFVDAFAGPWRVSEENYSDASFDQALRTLEAVRADLGKKRSAGLKVRFCFCERERRAVTQLRDYAKKQEKFEIYVFHGSFEDHLDDIAQVCRDGFTFTFIDPTGWNVRSEPVLVSLRARNGEFLLNFMAEDINRHAEYSQVSASFGRFLANPEWTDQFKALFRTWSNEARVLHLLRRKVKASRAATYLADFPIHKPKGDRVKMRLLLGTHSAKGLEVFRDVQSSVERRQMETQNQLRHEADDQVSRFTDDEIAAMQQEEAGIGCQKFQREAETRVVELLSTSGTMAFSLLSIHVLENVPMRLTQIRGLINGMKRRRVVNFCLPPRKRVPNQRRALLWLGPTTVLAIVRNELWRGVRRPDRGHEPIGLRLMPAGPSRPQPAARPPAYGEVAMASPGASRTRPCIGLSNATPRISNTGSNRISWHSQWRRYGNAKDVRLLSAGVIEVL